MARGNKEFFRHSTDAHLNHKIMGMVDEFGKESYYHYFVLVEICARMAIRHSVTPRKFTLNRRRLCTSFRIKNSKLKFHLNAMLKHDLIDFELDDFNASIVIVSLAKYLGKYEPKAEEKSPTAKRTAEEKDKAKQIKLAYSTSYKERYGITPTFAKKEHALVYTLMERAGFDLAFKLARAYPFYNDPWHLKIKHPFPSLVRDIDKVRVELNDPRRMLDSHRAQKQIVEAEETTELQDEKRRAREAIEEERRQIANEA